MLRNGGFEPKTLKPVKFPFSTFLKNSQNRSESTQIEVPQTVLFFVREAGGTQISQINNF